MITETMIWDIVGIILIYVGIIVTLYFEWKIDHGSY